MSVDERTRHEMYLGLEAALGGPVADALMAHLPPTGWGDVARTHDVDRLRGETVASLDRFRSDVQSMEAGLRGDMQSMEAGLRGDMQSIETSIRSDMQSMEARLRVDMGAMEERIGLRLDARIASEANRLLLFLIPTMTTMVGLTFAAAKLA